MLDGHYTDTANTGRIYPATDSDGDGDMLLFIL